MNLANINTYYAMYDKAVAENDEKTLKKLSMFTNKKIDGSAFVRRQICENMVYNALWTGAGYKGIPLNEYGWHEPNFPVQKQKITQLGEIINRGYCNISEKQLISFLHLPNGKWVAKVMQDYTNIDKGNVYLGIWNDQYDTRTEAWNKALMTFINDWKRRNKGVKKDDEAIKRAKSLIIVERNFFKYNTLPKGEHIQMSLF